MGDARAREQASLNLVAVDTGSGSGCYAAITCQSSDGTEITVGRTSLVAFQVDSLATG